MRFFISILLALSLSSVTMSHACGMEALSALGSDCHCPHGDETASDAAADDCCDVVIDSAIDAHQPGIAATTPVLDWPVLHAAPLHTVQFAAPTVRRTQAPPPLHGPPGKGSRTYLATARLRL